ncbi:MAG: hypothetical protein RIQ38_1521 [Pseudomonadota bacterium]
MKTTSNTSVNKLLLTLPKVTLHEHLDGGLRPATLLALARAQGVALPHTDPDALAQWLLAQANSGSLAQYLRAFDWTVPLMASEAACEQVAYEAAEDARAEGCVLAEFRMAPQLLAPHGLPADRALAAMLRGLRQSPLRSGLIVCGMRHHTPEQTLEAARLAVRHQADGVVGFDLAGPELGHPLEVHRPAIQTALAGGLGLTLHAGEAGNGLQVLRAAALGARRIGHGVHIIERQEWTEQARDLGLHFEVCPSSNVHTGAAPSLAEHPIRAMLAAGLSVSVATDNRLMSATSLCQELGALHAHTGLTLAQLAEMQSAGIRASFLPADWRRDALGALSQWQATLP